MSDYGSRIVCDICSLTLIVCVNKLILTSQIYIYMNEWMNEWCIYIALFVHPKRFTIMWGGLSSTTTSVQHPFGWCDGCHRTTAPVRSPHTSYRWRERVIDPIKWMGIIRRPWLTRASGGNLVRTTGLHPYSFMRSAMGFLMTTESQDLGLSSHPKDSACWQYSVPITILGC